MWPLTCHKTIKHVYQAEKMALAAIVSRTKKESGTSIGLRREHDHELDLN